MVSFKDHFSGNAPGYAAFRPCYPDALFAALARLAPRRGAAWDAGTGTGQAAVGLARHFDTVLASDASHAQVQNAGPHDHVHFFVATSERAPLPPGCVDLVLVAQALHWMEWDSVYAEARRVGTRGAVVATVCYGPASVSPAVDEPFEALYSGVLGDYWPPERALVDAGYADIPFPFEPLEVPAMAMDARWNLDQMAGYLRTWSATQRYLRATGEDPVAAMLPRIAAAWGDPVARHTVRWPLHVRAGRVGDD